MASPWRADNDQLLYMFTGMCEQQILWVESSQAEANQDLHLLSTCIILAQSGFNDDKMPIYVLSMLNPCCVTVAFCCAGFVSGLGFLFILIRWVPSVYMQSFVFIYVYNRFDIYEKRKSGNLDCVFVISQFVLRSFNIISLITNEVEIS